MPLFILFIIKASPHNPTQPLRRCPALFLRRKAQKSETQKEEGVKKFVQALAQLA
jgi:hypothetical protein